MTTVTIIAMKTSKSYKKYMLLTTQNRRHTLHHSTSQDTRCCSLIQNAHSFRKHWFCLFCYTDLNNSHSSITCLFLQVYTDKVPQTSNDILLEQLVSHMCCQHSQFKSTVVAVQQNIWKREMLISVSS